MKNLKKKLHALDARISHISCFPTAGVYSYYFVVFSSSFRSFVVVKFLSPNTSIHDDFRIIEAYRSGILDVDIEDIYDAFDTFARHFGFTAKHLTSHAVFTSEELYAIDNKNISNLIFKFL